MSSISTVKYLLEMQKIYTSLSVYTGINMPLLLVEDYLKIPCLHHFWEKLLSNKMCFCDRPSIECKVLFQ